ncbi:MAG: glycosyltransferase involved in cell wall biosynthesis [Zhongshania aliphaticivorans]|jgi:glycosyltransferase involved in cell wall biosynthesis
MRGVRGEAVGRDIYFSVIVASYNSANTISDALESLLAQTYKSFELILVDGNSKDSTINIVKEYCEKLHVSHLISEDDSGISEAWNKGLEVARGEFVLFLNADDYWPPLYLRTIKDELNSELRRGQSGCVYYGATQMVSTDGVFTRLVDKKFNAKLLGVGFRFMHTSCVVSRQLYQKVGKFDEDVKIAIDTDWLLRAYKQGADFKKLSHTNYMREGGVSDEFRVAAYDEYLSRAKAQNILTFPAWFYKAIMRVWSCFKK